MSILLEHYKQGKSPGKQHNKKNISKRANSGPKHSKSKRK